MISRNQAISNLVGALRWEEGSDEVVYMDGQTPPTEAAIQAEIDRHEAEWTTNEYSRNRQADYPDWGTQLNKIYDDGIDKWKSEMVNPIKAKWPKDNSGPVE